MSRPPAPGGGRRVDLHTHTVFSDGTLTPEELVSRARDRGLAALAVTDHDTVEALPRAAVTAAEVGIDLVPGLEMSSTLEGSDLHILGYHVHAEHPGLRERLRRFVVERRERALAILERLRTLGAEVDSEEVFALAGPGVVGRPHVAEALVRAGHVMDLDEAFQRFLGARGRAFVPRPAFRPDEAIAHIREAGGVAVLAHPGASTSDAMVERLVSVGLGGIEVWHPQHGAGAVHRYRALARRLGLVETGGSDYHGPQPHRSIDLGDMPVDESVLLPLRRAAAASG